MSVAYKKLQKFWYQKLKEDGFEDIEAENYSRPSSSSWLQSKYTPQKFEEKQNYYQLASQFLSSHLFDRFEDYQIWKLHTDGVPLRKIAELNQKKTCQVFKTVKLLKVKMLEMV